MKVQTALLARYAEVEPQGGLLNVTGGGIRGRPVDDQPDRLT